MYDPRKVSYETLLKTFWESHDPTQGMRQGGDVGTQYRSGIYVYDAEQRAAAQASLKSYGERLKKAGHGAITTEIRDVPEFYYAEDYHQQYLQRTRTATAGWEGAAFRSFSMRIERRTTRDDSMSLRVACKSVGCSRTILAATAARTGGYCMPCVQAKERQQRAAHIRANRRDVDPYAGIDDPLQLLKIVHQPPKPDPLIRYAQPPRETAALYAELDSGQIAALVRYVHALLKKGDTHAAQDIASCLVAFVSADISSLLQEFIRFEALRPEFVFHRAAPKIRDLLTQHLARVAGRDRLLTDKLLCALAWVGDERVVDLFAGWRPNRPVGQRICTFLRISIRSKQVGSCRPIRSGAICITRSATRSLAPAPR